jgi:hypothetical protein
MGREILVKALLAPQSIKFIAHITSISIASKKANLDLCDPTADVFIEVRATCLEYRVGDDQVAKPHQRTFTMDLDKKIFYWAYVADKYEAINHDDMFKVAYAEVQKSINKKMEIKQ